MAISSSKGVTVITYFLLNRQLLKRDNSRMGKVIVTKITQNHEENTNRRDKR